MRITIARVSRRPSWPVWAVLIVAIWAVLGCAAIWLSYGQNRPVELCLFKWLTKTPCPTCGITRGAWQLLHGRILRAWLYNPLMFTIGMAFFFSVLTRVLFARAVRIRLTKKERTIAWICAGIIFFANWLYLIKYTM
jgi:hypothetical protein